MNKKIATLLLCSVLTGPGLLLAQQPVETQKPNSDYKPAFAGQTE
jgi:hypothetical protein